MKLRNRIYKIFTILVLLPTIILFSTPQPANAAPDFEIDTDYTVQYSYPNKYVTITEKVSYTVNNLGYYLPQGSKQMFDIVDFDHNSSNEELKFKKDSLSVTDSGGYPLSYTTTADGDAITLSVTQSRDINPHQTYTIIFSYKTHELLDLNGNITNIYIPGLKKTTPLNDTDTLGLTTQFSYETTLEVDDGAPAISYISPEGLYQTTSNNKTVIDIPFEKRTEGAAWIQLGDTQYYYFKIIQDTPITDMLTPEQLNELSDLLSTNIYTIPLPKAHAETNQQVYIKSSKPEPTDIEQDTEGNLTAIFEVPANESSNIIIEGYISMTLENNNGMPTPIPDFPISTYTSLIDDSMIDQYTRPDEYWEIDDPAIADLAASLADQANTIQELIRLDYDYVIDLLDYDETKVASDNPRYGALTTLRTESGVCMEYADLTTALLRAQGIPARAAVGYGNDPTGIENSIGTEQALEQQIGHQWVQVWIPNYGWMSVDPTWGDSSGRTYIGGNLDHILWLTMSSADQEDLGGTALYSANNITKNSFEPYQVYLQALSAEDFEQVKGDLTELNNYLQSYEDVEYADSNYFFKATMFGKALIIATPILVTVLILTAIFTITNIKRKQKLLEERRMLEDA